MVRRRRCREMVRGPGDPITRMPSCSRKSRANNREVCKDFLQLIFPVHVTMASVYDISRTSYDDPGGLPPGSPPTSTPLLIFFRCWSYLYMCSQ